MGGIVEMGGHGLFGCLCQVDREACKHIMAAKAAPPMRCSQNPGWFPRITKSIASKEHAYRGQQRNVS